MDLEQLFTVTDYHTATITIPFHDSNSVSEKSLSKNGDSDSRENEGSHNDDITSKPDEISTSFADTSIKMLEIEVTSSAAACTDYDLTGQIVWPVSNLLSHYLASKVGQTYLRNRRVVELGAGCGLPGLVAAACGSVEQVILTDGNQIVTDLLQQNVDQFKKKQQQINSSVPPTTTPLVSASQLAWGNRKQCHELMESIGHVDVVIAADVVQWPAVVEPLLHTTKALLWSSTSSSEPRMILGIVNRASNTYNLFFQTTKELGFTCRKVPPTEYFQNGVIPPSCQECGGRQTELFHVVLTDRTHPPVLLNNNNTDDTKSGGEDILVGKNYGKTAFLPY